MLDDTVLFDDVFIRNQPSIRESRMDKINMLLAHLNPKQQEAVEHTEGPLLVLAGAGTGKTAVLTHRIAYILTKGLAEPRELLAVTFTNKAAKEMKERLDRLVDQPTEGIWLGTFHALSGKILRHHAELIGLDQHYTIIDTDDQLRLIKQLAGDAGFDEKRDPPKSILAHIQHWKDQAITYDGPMPKKVATSGKSKYWEIYHEYQQRLLQLQAVDFGDMLLYVIQLLRAHPDIQRHYQDRFRYILVDEYQDTNIAQYLWLRLLTGQKKNICCVGDDDQSIYSWRGAEIANILQFEKEFPNAKVIRLEQNYRSTSHILAAASGLIDYNEGRLGKTLWTNKEGGSKIRLSSFYDSKEEARFIAHEIEALQYHQKIDLKDMAILVRAGYQTRAFEESFVALGIPYMVVGGLKFYERQEIRDCIAYIRAAVQPRDDLAFERVINLPKRGIGATTLSQAYDTSRRLQLSLQESVLHLINDGGIKGKAAQALSIFLEQLTRFRQSLREATRPLGTIVQEMIQDTGYLAMWEQNQEQEAKGRLENIQELIRGLNDFTSVDHFLEHVSLVHDNDKGQSSDMVTIMTLHAAKGLEYRVVFLPGWEEGLFPNQRALSDAGSAALEEERRLAYVGITRARELSYISYASRRQVYYNWQPAIPSRFIAEIPEDSVEHYSMESGLEYHISRQVTPYSPTMSKPEIPTHQPGHKLGSRVFHIKFGYGTVIGIDGANLRIMFEKTGEKTVLAEYLQ